jgi:hypothetical protein
MVTSYKIDENKMDYRGSKSVFQYPEPNETTVKEQRVDGSYFGLNPKLRCTLMGYENSYQFKILSKQFILNKTYYSTINKNSKLNPYFVSGLVDAEGSFGVFITKNDRYKNGWSVRSLFQIVLHLNEAPLMRQFEEFFNCIGVVKFHKNRKILNYSVANLNDLTTTLIPHFKKYPLLTQKAADFKFFEQVVDIMNKGDHLTTEGLQQIINIKASINLGLSENLKSEFKDYLPVKKPIIETENIIDPNWISGFVAGEGNFDVGIKEKIGNKIGYEVYIRFRITQHEKDINLMKLIIKHLGTGRLEQSKNQVVVTVSKISDINNIIIPFFKQYPICGDKTLDFIE